MTPDTIACRWAELVEQVQALQKADEMTAADLNSAGRPLSITHARIHKAAWNAAIDAVLRLLAGERA